MSPTKIIFNPDTFLCEASYEEVDEDVVNELFHHRFDKCNFCEELYQKDFIIDDKPTTVYYCGCCPISNKWKIIFPLDDNGNAFDHTVIYEGKFGYVCKLKKW